MNKPSDSDLLNLDCEARYDYFLGDVAENGKSGYWLTPLTFFKDLF